jgi:DNA-binding CsgD family transcriptional regulator
MRRLLDRTRAGAGTALFVEGEAGLGKTTVLDHARSLAEGSMRVAVGRGDSMESALPFGLLAQVFEDLGGRDVLEIEDAHHQPLDARAAEFHRALRWLQEDVSDPVLIALDDLHWSDADSLSLLAFLVRRIGELPIAVMGTLRPWPPAAHEACLSLIGAGHATLERLRPLSEAASRMLVAERSGRPVTEDRGRQAWELCAGNPLLLEQVALALGRGEALPSASSSLADELLLARFAGIPPAAMRCAQAGSVLGARFRSDVAAAIAQLAEGEAEPAIDALCRSGLVQPAEGTSVEFAHPLFAQALYDDLAGPIRSRLHGRAFEYLRQRGMESEAAEHAVRGDLRGDPQAIALLESTGNAALRAGALATAAQRLDAAVDFAGDRADANLLLQFGEALLATARPESTDIFERALRLELTPAARVRALHLQARALSARGAHALASKRFDEAVALAEAHEPSAAVDAMLDHALTRWYTFGPKDSYPLAVRARELAQRLGENTRQRADAVWGFLALQLGDPSGFEAVATAARPVLIDPYSDLLDLYSHFSRLSLYANACNLTERFDESDSTFRLIGVTVERIGALNALAGLRVNHAYLMLRTGQLEPALGLFLQGMDLVDLVPYIEPFAAAGLAIILLLMGRHAESAGWWERADATAPPDVGNARFFMLDCRGHREYREGRLTEASDTYLELEATVDRMGIGEPCLPAWGRHAVAAHIGCERIADARRVVDLLEQLGGALPCRFPNIAAATGRALLAEHAGDRASADASFRAALALHENVDLRGEKVETLLAYGAFLRHSGRPSLARPVLAEAVALADGIGARWLAEHAADELAVAGGRPRNRRASDELTAQERRVALLTAEGRSNREIAAQLSLSIPTIETHLQRIYAKLGIHSRRELMLAAARGALAGGGCPAP